MSWRKRILLLPKLIYHGLRAPRDSGVAWERYWSEIRRTGIDGDVLWDAGSSVELERTLALVRAHLPATLPVVDIGCGNGRYSRALAPYFPRLIGIDYAAAAVAHAQTESAEMSNVQFRVADLTAPQIGQRVVEELGEVNVYMRGVLHTQSDKQRVALIKNIRQMLGRNGVFFYIETDHEGNPLDLIASLVTPSGELPPPLFRTIAAGLPIPRHFGEREHDKWFPSDTWKTLTRGRTEIYGVPMTQAAQPERLSAWYAIVKPR